MTSWLKRGSLAIGLMLGLWGTAHSQESAISEPCSRLEDGDLPKLLENMGYAPEKVDDGVYRVVIDQDNWTIYLRFSLSTDGGQKVWITTSFGDIADWQNVPAEPLLRLLILNDTIGPAHFYVTQAGAVRKLNMAKAVDNRGVTASVLRREIDKFVGSVKTTADQWDTASWTKPAAGAADPNAPAAATPSPEAATTPGTDSSTPPSSAATPPSSAAEATPSRSAAEPTPPSSAAEATPPSSTEAAPSPESSTEAPPAGAAEATPTDPNQTSGKP